MEIVLLVADIHWTAIDGIRKFLEEQFQMPDVAYVTSCREVMAQLKIRKYTHLIMELIFDDDTSASIIPIIKELYPDLRIAIFSPLNNGIKEHLRDYGVFHFISKALTKEDTVKAFQKFFNNELPIDSLRKLKKSDNRLRLSPRELQVYTLALANNSNDQIASKLNLAKNSVSTIKYRITQKEVDQG